MDTDFEKGKLIQEELSKQTNTKPEENPEGSFENKEKLEGGEMKEKKKKEKLEEAKEYARKKLDELFKAKGFVVRFLNFLDYQKALREPEHLTYSEAIMIKEERFLDFYKDGVTEDTNDDWRILNWRWAKLSEDYTNWPWSASGVAKNLWLIKHFKETYREVKNEEKEGKQEGIEKTKRENALELFRERLLDLSLDGTSYGKQWEKIVRYAMYKDKIVKDPLKNPFLERVADDYRRIISKLPKDVLEDLENFIADKNWIKKENNFRNIVRIIGSYFGCTDISEAESIAYNIALIFKEEAFDEQAVYIPNWGVVKKSFNPKEHVLGAIVMTPDRSIIEDTEKEFTLQPEVAHPLFDWQGNEVFPERKRIVGGKDESKLKLRG